MFVMGKMVHGKGPAERGKALDAGAPCPTAALAPSSSHHGQERLARGAGDAPQPREEPGTLPCPCVSCSLVLHLESIRACLGYLLVFRILDLVSEVLVLWSNFSSLVRASCRVCTK